MIATSLNIKCSTGNFICRNSNDDKVEVIATYDNEMPQEIKNIYNPKHKGEGVNYFDYVFVTARSANLREKPDPKI